MLTSTRTPPLPRKDPYQCRSHHADEVSARTISAREAEVLAALGEHLTNAEIGARLFISIRTVESHVSSLLRKLQVDDRRALAAISANLHSDPAGGAGAPAAVAGLPSPLTPFVGRVTERAELNQALHEHRLVTAVGPGGVGKTRLALSVAADANDRFTDGVWYVNLVPVTDPLMIAPAIADALGPSRATSAAARTRPRQSTGYAATTTPVLCGWTSSMP